MATLSQYSIMLFVNHDFKYFLFAEDSRKYIFFLTEMQMFLSELFIATKIAWFFFLKCAIWYDLPMQCLCNEVYTTGSILQNDQF